jgi:hypothetical protein
MRPIAPTGNIRVPRAERPPIRRIRALTMLLNRQDDQAGSRFETGLQ